MGSLNNMGRPTDLTPELIAKAKTYLATCVDDLSDKDFRKVQLPSLAGLAIFLKCSRESVHTWRYVNEEFSDILAEILAEQEKRLLGNGLGGTYNAQITKLVLGKHGYHDTAAIDHTTKGEKIEGGLTPSQSAIIAKFEEELKKSMT